MLCDILSVIAFSWIAGGIAELDISFTDDFLDIDFEQFFDGFFNVYDVKDGDNFFFLIFFFSYDCNDDVDDDVRRFDDFNKVEDDKNGSSVGGDVWQ